MGDRGLEETVADLVRTVAALRAELDAVKSELSQLKGDRPAAGPAGAHPSASAPPVADEPPFLQPMTYAEAFEAIGGESELQKYATMSTDLAAAIDDRELDAELKRLLPREYAKRRGFSTKLVNQEFCATLEELYAKANAVHAKFDDAICTLAGRTGGRPLVPAVKGEVRARMKALFKYSYGDHGVAWYRLTDLVRATIEYDDLAALYGGLRDVVAHFGASVLEMNDRYQQPLAGGYRDIQLAVRFEGHVCELQLSTGAMTRAKMTTGHRDFEVIRQLRSAVAKGDLSRVVNALEFGREHLMGGTAESSGAALRELLRSTGARTLTHQAASGGHAEILHAFLLHGADPDARDASGNTPLHASVLAGHERCVWVLLDVGRADLDLRNHEGNTALVEGYLMLWQRPPESAVRSVSTLAQVCGAERIRTARSEVDAQLRKRLKPSRQLVDHAACGDIGKMIEELHRYADPNSTDKGGQSAVEAAAVNGQLEALEALLPYKPTIDLFLLPKIPLKVLKQHPDILVVLEEMGLSTIKCVAGAWPRGPIKTVPLVEGCRAHSDRSYEWRNVPPSLVGVMARSPCHCNDGLVIDVLSCGDTIGVILAHGNRDEYGSTKAFEEDLSAKGFERMTIPEMWSTSFDRKGVDVWLLAGAGRRTVRIETFKDMEMNIILLRQGKINLPCVAEVVAGPWPRGPLRMVRLTNGATHYTDRSYSYDCVPEELEGCFVSVNPCHGAGAELKVTARDQVVGILLGVGAKDAYEGGFDAMVSLLEEELGFEGPQRFEQMRSGSFNRPGMLLWRRSFHGKGTVTFRVTRDVEFNVVSMPAMGGTSHVGT